ncbi:hypothetical protein [Campylobacter rectus]|uniref:hypothetical protein n=1 Tax=Campylobacter rectus TaxID=203 RepID=UPI0028EE7B8E|nr:hypothetical protein [Campylobacter rectus]
MSLKFRAFIRRQNCKFIKPGKPIKSKNLTHENRDGNRANFAGRMRKFSVLAG